MNISAHTTHNLNCIVCSSVLKGKQTRYCSTKCKNTYQPNTHYKYQKARAMDRKTKLIELKGGKCIKCGYSKCIKALEFHHLDPSQKEMKMDSRNLAGTNLKKIMAEIDKCVLVCSNCHREIHDAQYVGLDS